MRSQLPEYHTRPVTVLFRGQEGSRLKRENCVAGVILFGRIKCLVLAEVLKCCIVTGTNVARLTPMFL